MTIVSVIMKFEPGI